MTKEVALHREEGNSIWMLGHLITIKATAEDTGGAFALVEQLGPPGAGSPAHTHHGEDEFFYVIEGEVTFTIGDRELVAKPGTFILGPRGIQHQFVTTGDTPSRMLLGFSPAGFENFMQEMGEPASSLSLPPPREPDMGKLLSLSGKYNFEIHPPE